MARIYGYRWASQYGDEDDGTWAAGLRDYSEAEVYAGIQACIDGESHWPPTLPEFRRLCRPEKRENEAMYRMPVERQLPHKITDAERATAQEQLAALRAGLK